MGRFIKTVSTSGESSGGTAGLSAADVCATICTLLPKYTGQVGLTTTFIGRKELDCSGDSETYAGIGVSASNTTNYPGTDAGLQYATASGAVHSGGNWYPLAVCNCWTCCYQDCTCLEFSFPSHCYDAFIIRWNGVQIKRCCYFNYLWAFGTDSCYSRGQSHSSGNGCCQFQQCTVGQDTCLNALDRDYYMPYTNWSGFNGICVNTNNSKYRGIWISGDRVQTTQACYDCAGQRTINVEWQFWRYNNHMSGAAWVRSDRICDSEASTLSDGTCFICNPYQTSCMSCQNEFWAMNKASFRCCAWKGWRRTYFQPGGNACWISCAGNGVCWNDCCPQCDGRQFSKFILFPCCHWCPHLTSYCDANKHLNYHTSWCILGLNKCVPGFTGEEPTGQAI